MAKIGRNEPCPCGSGRKYKHCCMLTRPAAPPPDSAMTRARASLMREIGKIRDAAVRHRESLLELGVFILFSNRRGDAWLLEVTDRDAVQLVRGGEPLPVPVNEDPREIEIDWSHTFAIRDRRFFLTAYADGKQTRLEHVPCKRIQSIIRRIYKQNPPELLDRVHITPAPGEETGGTEA
ncbi:MAG TPA: hypothetical protein ENK27_00935 [Desulfobulbus sp.]|nr:hypothetical protein [Desulfobulbus sp.]